MSVLSVDDAKTHLNITVPAYDLELGAFINAVESAIARLTGPLEPTEVTATVTGGPVLSLPTTPVISLTSLTDSSGAVVDVTDLFVSTTGVIWSATGSFPARFYTAVWEAGRDVDADTNADLYLAIKEMLRHKWATQRGRPGSVPEQVPGAAYSFPYTVSELIAPHIQPV